MSKTNKWQYLGSFTKVVYIVVLLFCLTIFVSILHLKYKLKKWKTTRMQIEGKNLNRNFIKNPLISLEKTG